MIRYLRLKRQKGREERMVELAVELFTQLVTACVPIACVFEIGNLLIGMFLRAAFGGGLWLGR